MIVDKDWVIILLLWNQNYQRNIIEYLITLTTCLDIATDVSPKHACMCKTNDWFMTDLWRGLSILVISLFQEPTDWIYRTN